MSVRKGLGALALAAGLAGAALAQDVPLTPAQTLPNDPDAVVVQELVVTARDKGPAWWTVSNGTSTVYVLGTPSIAPKHMQWDRSAFERRLKGASEVILPYQDVHVRLVGAPGVMISLLRLKSFTPFESTLDPQTRGRFAAVRTRLGYPAGRYDTHNPLAAGLKLAMDYRDRSGLTNSDPTKLIKLLAQRAHVPIVQKSYNLGPLMGAIIHTPPAAGRACFDAVLAQAEAGPAATMTATQAWAKGDVAGALANERTYERCMAMVPGAAAFDDKVKADMVGEIEAALKQPGHAIAAVPLRPLLAQNGVLERLKQAGFEVKTPGED